MRLSGKPSLTMETTLETLQQARWNDLAGLFLVERARRIEPQGVHAVMIFRMRVSESAAAWISVSACSRGAD